MTHEYLSQTNASSGKFVSERPERGLRWVTIDQEALRQELLIIKIGYKFSIKVGRPVFGVVIYTEGGSPIFGSNTMYHPSDGQLDEAQEGEVTVIFKQLPLWSGHYRISVWFVGNDGGATIDHEEYALTFEFVSPSTPVNAPQAKYVGPIHLPAIWMSVKR